MNGSALQTAHLELDSGLSLRMVPRGRNPRDYPTGGIQKGMLLSVDGIDLAEEGVGFGLPILKQRYDTIFPGSVRITGAPGDGLLTADFQMCMAERFAAEGRGPVRSRFVTIVKESLARIHRQVPPLRKPLSVLSAGLRTFLSLRTVFHVVESLGTIRVQYLLDRSAGRLDMKVDARGAARESCTELIVMNEQGAHHFHRYHDSQGQTLAGTEVGTWVEVQADQAGFIDRRHRVRFSLAQAPNARLFRGREVIPGRLAWTGFGYILKPTTEEFHCSVLVGRTP